MSHPNEPWKTSSGLLVHIPLDEIIHHTTGSFPKNIDPSEYVSYRIDTSYHFSMALRTIGLFVGFLCIHNALTALWISMGLFVLGYTYMFMQDEFPFCNMVDLLSTLYISLRKLIVIIPAAVITISLVYHNFWPSLAYVLSHISTFALRFLIDLWYKNHARRCYGVDLTPVDAKAARISYRYSDSYGILTFRAYLSGTIRKLHNAPQRNTPSASISGSQFSILKAATSLASLTVSAIDSFDREESSVYLCHSNATKTDTILFSCFLLRSMCIMSTENHQFAAVFSREYVSDIREALSKKNLLNASFEKIFNDRTELYDRIFMSKQEIDKKLSAISEEFEYVITNDILKDGLAPFYENSPLPIIGIQEAMECRMEVANYMKFLLSYTNQCVDQVIASIQ